MEIIFKWQVFETSGHTKQKLFSMCGVPFVERTGTDTLYSTNYLTSTYMNILYNQQLQQQPHNLYKTVAIVSMQTKIYTLFLLLASPHWHS